MPRTLSSPPGLTNPRGRRQNLTRCAPAPTDPLSATRLRLHTRRIPSHRRAYRALPLAFRPWPDATIGDFLQWNALLCACHVPQPRPSRSTPVTPSCPAHPPWKHCPPPVPRALCIKACAEGDCEGDSQGQSARRHHSTSPRPPRASIQSFFITITITIACRRRRRRDRRRDQGGKPTPHPLAPCDRIRSGSGGG